MEGDVGLGLGTQAQGEPGDADLFVEAMSGSAAAWSHLTSRHARRLWAIARSMGLDAAAASDVVQTTWLRLIAGHQTIREPASLRWWLNSVARNEAIAVSRRGRREAATEAAGVDVADGAPRAEELVVERESDAVVRSALRRISERCQTLLRLLFSSGDVSYDDIGQLLDMPIGSIGPTRRRCLERLRLQIDGYDP